VLYLRLLTQSTSFPAHSRIQPITPFPKLCYIALQLEQPRSTLYPLRTNANREYLLLLPSTLHTNQISEKMQANRIASTDAVSLPLHCAGAAGMRKNTMSINVTPDHTTFSTLLLLCLLVGCVLMIFLWIGSLCFLAFPVSTSTSNIYGFIRCTTLHDISSTART
jgi:hypothetical protein